MINFKGIIKRLVCQSDCCNNETITNVFPICVKIDDDKVIYVMDSKCLEHLLNEKKEKLNKLYSNSISIIQI
jgi:hypothetical protein